MLARPDYVMMTSSGPDPHPPPDDVMLMSSGSDLYPTRLWTRFRPPRLPTARAGASDVRFGRSWYQRAHIEMVYNVVYLIYMFEAVTNSKICKELYVCVFLGYFCMFSCISLWFWKYV